MVGMNRAKSPQVATSVLSFLLGLGISFLFFSRQLLPAPCPKPRTIIVKAAAPPATKCSSTAKRLVIDMTPTTAGGVAHYTELQVRTKMLNPLVYGIYDDLMAFSGLSAEELLARLKRDGRHHFAIEHRFYNPKSTAELAMFYRSSVAYLWANAMHPSIDHSLLGLSPSDGPVLDYSGGVGSSCIGLAKMGIKCIYFGIGQMEFEFAQFRVKRHGLSHLVSFVKPYATDLKSGYHFDPVKALKLGSTLPEKLGAVFALDVFEHIPDYHIVAQHLVSLLRDGGKVIENTTFNTGSSSDQDIHLKDKVPLATALKGTRFVKRVGTIPQVQIWVKENSVTV